MNGFVIGGDDPLALYRCGKVTVPSLSAGAVLISTDCEDAGDYRFRLESGSDPHAYLITVKSKYGINVDEFPVTYLEGEGWHGERDQLVDGETLSITAMVTRIEGRNWHGWTMLVVPTTAIEADSDELTRQYFKVDFTARK